MLGAGSVDGMCEQLVAGTVADGDVLVALGSTLVVWLTVPGWPEEVPGLWRAPHVAPGMAMVGGASNAGGMWADWVDRVVRPGGEGGGGDAGGDGDGDGDGACGRAMCPSGGPGPRGRGSPGTTGPCGSAWPAPTSRMVPKPCGAGLTKPRGSSPGT